MGIVLITLYLAVLLLLCGYGLHRARLAWLCLRCQPSLLSDGSAPILSDGSAPILADGSAPILADGSAPILADGSAPVLRDGSAPPLLLAGSAPNGSPAVAVSPSVDSSAAGTSADELPFITVQLPIYNEATVVQRLLEAASKLIYPRHRLEIQVLDDSDDETRVIAEGIVHRLRETGLDIAYLRRTSREGYKAGALDFGLQCARGELIAIFDADFVPPADFLMATVGHFRDADVGMVQGRWGHLNRDANMLTSLQALMLDGHHLVENRARFASGCFFNFSGTAGMWRRRAIDDAGGWQHDTLTEDLDLSYRAQLAGWRFIYRPDVVAPSELPEDVFAFRAQQYRWAKGTVQTARKLLPSVLNAPISRQQRLEALFHLTPHFAYPLMILLCLLLPFALVMLPVADDWVALLIVDVPLCFGATGSLAAFYAMANRAQGRSIGEAMVKLPALMALGIGLSPYLTRAVFEGLAHDAGEFVRTPKRGLRASRYRQLRAPLPLPELVLALVGVASVVISIETNHFLATPFAMLFAFGYAYMAGLMTTEQLARRRALAPSAASVIAKI